MKPMLNGLTLAELETASQSLAETLALHSGCPIVIVVGERSLTAAGHGDKRDAPAIQIELDPEWLATVRSKDQALKIWRGLAARELARALYPATEQYQKAIGPGTLQVFHVLSDEHAIRLTIAAYPELGPDLQALSAFVFPTRGMNNDALSTGTVDGGIQPAAGRRGAITGTRRFGTRFNQFAYGVRRHRQVTPADEQVTSALNEVGLAGETFKDLSNDQVLQLAERVSVILSAGIAETDEPATVLDVEDQPVTKAKVAVRAAGSTPGTPAAPATDDGYRGRAKPAWTFKRIISNPITLVTFGLFIAGWSYVLLQAGVQFWVVATTAVAAAGALLTTLAIAHRTIVGPYFKAFWKIVGPILKGTLLVVAAGAVLTLIVILLLKVPLPILAVGLSTVAVLVCGCVAWGHGVNDVDDDNFDQVNRYIGLALAGSSLALGASTYWLMTGLGFDPFFIWIFIGPTCLTLVAMAGVLMVPVSGEAGAGTSGLLYWLLLPGRLVIAFLTGTVAIIGGVLSGLKDAFLGGCDYVARGWKALCRGIRAIGAAIGRLAQDIFWNAEPMLIRFAAIPLVRIAVISLPFAVVLVGIGSVLVTVLFGGEASYVWLAFLAVVLIALVVTAVIFRKRLGLFVTEDMFEPVPQMAGTSDDLPLDTETETFTPMGGYTVDVAANPDVLARLMPRVNTLVAGLRPALVNLGSRVIEKDGQEDGDLGDEPEQIQAGDLGIHEDDHPVQGNSIHFEIGIDCSVSEKGATGHLAEGEKFERAQIMGLTVENACVGLDGISGNVWGMDDHVIFNCGVLGENRASGLETTGANNDAGWLEHMRQSALASGKQVKILIMISDGQPADSSWRALRNVVLAAEQDGMIVWQFATDQIKQPAIDRLVTDLYGQSLEEAVAHVAQTLQAIAEEVM